MAMVAKKRSIKKLGNDIEEMVKQHLFRKMGYWVTKLEDSKTGQPFDLIAIRNEEVLCIEVKHVEKLDYISIDRLEDNQLQAFELLTLTGSGSSCFVFVVFGDEDTIYYTTFHRLQEEKKIKKSNLTRLWSDKYD